MRLKVVFWLETCSSSFIPYLLPLGKVSRASWAFPFLETICFLSFQRPTALWWQWWLSKSLPKIWKDPSKSGMQGQYLKTKQNKKVDEPLIWRFRLWVAQISLRKRGSLTGHVEFSSRDYLKMMLHAAFIGNELGLTREEGRWKRRTRTRSIRESSVTDKVTFTPCVLSCAAWWVHKPLHTTASSQWTGVEPRQGKPQGSCSHTWSHFLLVTRREELCPYTLTEV